MADFSAYVKRSLNKKRHFPFGVCELSQPICAQWVQPFLPLIDRFIRFENVARAAEGGEEDQGVAGG